YGGEGRHLPPARAARDGGRMVGAHHPRRLTVELQRIGEWVWEIPRQGGMRVPGRIYASEKLMAELRDDPALAQLANVARRPGLVGGALAMPDIHWGYGFPIGGVAAVDVEEGAISPGGIGFDINCGVRLLRTALAADDLGPHLARVADALYQAIPAGVGSEGAIPKLTRAEEKQMLARGAAWAVAREFGRASDLEATEEGGCLRDADPDAVSETALERGRSQVGTLGSGNHFLEVQRVDEVYDARRAALRARLRRLPQHRQARGAHGRRPAAARVRAPQGRHARLRPGPSRPRHPSPSARAAGHHPRRHGPLLLPPPRHRGRDGRDLRYDLPRRGPGHDPGPGE